MTIQGVMLYIEEIVDHCECGSRVLAADIYDYVISRIDDKELLDFFHEELRRQIKQNRRALECVSNYQVIDI